MDDAAQFVDEVDLVRLVERAVARDPDAWEAIYRRLHPRLFALARRRVADSQSAEDVVSETMARALRAIDGFRWAAGGIDGWLFGILRNVLLEGYRSDARHSRHRFDHRHETATGDEPAQAAIDGDERDRLWRAFEQLDPDEREVLELRVVAALSSDAAAVVLGMRPGAVRMAQSRALERLRVFLAQDDHAR